VCELSNSATKKEEKTLSSVQSQDHSSMRFLNDHKFNNREFNNRKLEFKDDKSPTSRAAILAAWSAINASRWRSALSTAIRAFSLALKPSLSTGAGAAIGFPRLMYEACAFQHPHAVCVSKATDGCSENQLEHRWGATSQPGACGVGCKVMACIPNTSQGNMLTCILNTSLGNLLTFIPNTSQGNLLTFIPNTSQGYLMRFEMISTAMQRYP
jgi:hypothetical protein